MSQRRTLQVNHVAPSRRRVPFTPPRCPSEGPGEHPQRCLLDAGHGGDHTAGSRDWSDTEAAA